MNIQMLQRTIRRHRYLKTKPAYDSFLRRLASRGDVWMVPQREVAAWWESRQASEILLDQREGVLRVSCDLSRAVVETDGATLLIPPFELPAPPGSGRTAPCVTYGCSVRFAGFAPELLGHLGYGHVKPASPGRRPDIGAGELEPILERLRATALLHWNYTSEDLEALRALLRRAHRAQGLPELRLWPLPHYRGAPYRVCVSSRFDVDRAIVNMPLIRALEERHGMRSTAYLRPLGPFYGRREIEGYLAQAGESEIALHGEFVTTAERRFGDELTAAVEEKKRLEEIIGQRVAGVCMHGGELRSNVTERTADAIEAAQFRYETMYRNQYYLPLHLPAGDGTRRTLSIGQHLMDMSVNPGPRFVEELGRGLDEQLARAESVGGVFVPVLHPLFFSVRNYLRHPENVLRLGSSIPRFLVDSFRMKRGQSYRNKP